MRSVVVSIILLYSCSGLCDWKFGVGAGYSPNFIMNMSGTSQTSGTISNNDKFEINHKAAMTLELSAINMPQNDWGFIGGFSFQSEREVESIILNGIKYNVVGESAKTQSHSFYIGTAYRWNVFYIPLTLNVSKTKFTPAPTSGATATYEDGLGIYFALGWMILGDHLAIEYGARSNVGKLNLTNSSNSDYSKIDGTSASAVLSVKYFF